MLTKDFYFELPEELIAQHPSGIRGQDKLMLLDKNSGAVSHHMMDELPDLIPEQALMIFNNSRVRRSRVYGIKETTGRETEFLFLHPVSATSPVVNSNTAGIFFTSQSGIDGLNGKAVQPAAGSIPTDTQTAATGNCIPEKNILQTSGTGNRPCNGADTSGSLWKTMVKNAKKQHPGNRYRFPDGTTGTIIPVVQDEGTEFRTLQFDRIIDESWFEANGHIPLPPYIRREDTEEDSERYQNIYATETGSAACPTAGLHFTQPLLDRLERKGIQRAWVTLHVGLGTFLPVRAEHIEEHKMHRETYSVSPETARLVNEAKAAGRPVLAVGTTSVRTLESAWDTDTRQLQPGIRSTNIFMYPGYRFNVVDAMFTNFHTPESTLLMLVSAFAGREHILAAYRQAVASRYRFFSYGDAMLII